MFMDVKSVGIGLFLLFLIRAKVYRLKTREIINKSCSSVCMELKDVILHRFVILSTFLIAPFRNMLYRLIATCNYEYN